MKTLKQFNLFLLVILSTFIFYSCAMIHEKESTSISMDMAPFFEQARSMAKNEQRGVSVSIGTFKITAKLTTGDGSIQEQTVTSLTESDVENKTIVFEKIEIGQKVSISLDVYQDNVLHFIGSKSNVLIESENTEITITLKKITDNSESVDTTPSEETSYSEKQGDVARANIEFDSKTFEKTKEIVIVPKGTQAVIEMTEEPIDYNGQGVFIKDRKVTLSPFVMSAYEVTQELYEAVMESNPSRFQGDSEQPASGEKQDLRPVEYVTWYDAVNFCNELTKKTMSEADCVYTITDIEYDNEEQKNYITNATVSIDLTKKGYRLPTEAEWEFAARGGDPTAEDWKFAYSGVQTGKEDTNFTSEEEDTPLNEYAWYTSNSSTKTHEVGTKKPNKLGLYDMSGNVLEWCWDQCDIITTDDVTDPLGAVSSYWPYYNVWRGGSWGYDAYYTSVSYRSWYHGHSCDMYGDLGFRLVRSSSNNKIW